MPNDTNFNRGTHGDSSFMLDGLPSSSEKPLPLGMGYVTQLDDLQIYLGSNLSINEHITIKQPKIKDIMDVGEREYFSMVLTLTSIPSDSKSFLFDNGIDWMEISDFEYFCLTALGLKKDQTYPLLGELDLSKFQLCKNKDGDMVLFDPDTKCIIDMCIHKLMTDFICKSHMIKPKIERAGNQYTKNYLIDEDRKRRERALLVDNKDYESTLLPLLSALINSPEFKYDLAGIRDLTLFQLKDSISRISIIRQSSVLHNGLYANGVDKDKLDNKLLDWARRIN